MKQGPLLRHSGVAPLNSWTLHHFTLTKDYLWYEDKSTLSINSFDLRQLCVLETEASHKHHPYCLSLTSTALFGDTFVVAAESESLLADWKQAIQSVIDYHFSSASADSDHEKEHEDVKVKVRLQN